MFIDEIYIESLLEKSKNVDESEVLKILKKAENKTGLSHQEIAILLQCDNENIDNEIFKLAGKIKNDIYGNRVVVFAPLYVSNYCVNNCLYCGYKQGNKFERRKLNKEEIQQEVKILESMGHKRLALEAGEDPKNCNMDYIIECIDAIYNTENKNGVIRRINVNVAATTVEDYTRLKEAKIGTYILFQETYHKKTYEIMHPNCLKGDYDYHLTGFDRAMNVGIDDVGAGVLFGLYEPKFEVLALMMHNEHLEKEFGVGFHTVSVPRLKKAEGMDLKMFSNIVDDKMFKKIVAILRIALPFVGIILSTRENKELREELINYGVSQISAGSCTGVGGYKESEIHKNIGQFETGDNRTPLEILKTLVNSGYTPSYCTACYRSGRTGDRFMRLAKTGQIQNVCSPNALMTLMEFILDYGDEELYKKGNDHILNEIEKIKKDTVRELVRKNIERLKNGERDLYF
jgi:2-iminoacetate synthase